MTTQQQIDTATAQHAIKVTQFNQQLANYDNQIAIATQNKTIVNVQLANENESFAKTIDNLNKQVSNGQTAPNIPHS